MVLRRTLAELRQITKEVQHVGHDERPKQKWPPAGNPPLGQIKVIPVDYDLIEKESAALKKRFNEIFQ